MVLESPVVACSSMERSAATERCDTPSSDPLECHPLHSWSSALELRGVPLPSELVDDSKEQPLADDPTEDSVRRLFSSSSLSEESSRGASFPVLSQYIAGAARRRAGACSLSCAVQSLYQHVPILHWLPLYTRKLLRSDLVGGITVGVVLIPQGMAYAMLAELPAIYGLYASLLPLPIYAAMASSRHMSIGPFALVSLLVADSVVDSGFDPDEPVTCSTIRAPGHCL